MSVKEFFAFANIKIAVVEFLKQKGEFDSLCAKHKKPFRAHINKHQSGQGANLPAFESEYNSGANTNNNGTNYADYFVSDGFNSIRCIFSEICKENFARMYPGSIKIFNTVNMLICIQQYQLQIRGGSTVALDDSNSSQPEVVLIVDELRVISFDRFQMKLPSSVQYDDLVRVHLNFFKHYSQKRSLLKSEYSLPEISKLPAFASTTSGVNEERPVFHPIGGRYNQKPQQSFVNTAQVTQAPILGKRFNTSPVRVKEDIQFQLKSDISSNKSEVQRQTKLRDSKRLRKLVENGPKLEGFLSCQGSQGYNELLMSLINSQSSKTSNDFDQSKEAAQKLKNSHMLSGSEFDELDAQLELLLEEKGEVEEKSSQKSISQTQPNLLSQHAEILKQKNQPKADSLPQISQSIEEILGNGAIQTSPEKVLPVTINNNEAISNSSSPLENEQIQRNIENEANAGKIELQIDLTEEQKKQQESLSFGASKSPIVANFQRNKPQSGIGYGQNSFKNQSDLIEMKRLQGQGQQGVQRALINSQDDLLDVLAADSQHQKSVASMQQSGTSGSAKKKVASKQSRIDFYIKKPVQAAGELLLREQGENNYISPQKMEEKQIANSKTKERGSYKSESKRNPLNK